MSATGRMVADLVVLRERDMGDIDALAKSIKEVRLLHPIVINNRDEVIAGRRRLAAVKLLGWSRVAVSVVDCLDDALLALKAERDENTCRKDYLPSEYEGACAGIEELEAAQAKERQGARTDLPEHSGKFPESERGRSRDAIAKVVGVSGKTYEHAKMVTKAARENPEKYGHLIAIMDGKGKGKGVNAAYKELKCINRGGANPKRTKAHKQLTAAAPDLLTACQRALAHIWAEYDPDEVFCEPNDDERKPLWEVASLLHAAITKATQERKKGDE